MVAVGTTTVRTLESWRSASGDVGDTRTFITLWFQCQVVDMLVTNSTQKHFDDASAPWRVTSTDMLYRHAIDQKYRFFSARARQRCCSVLRPVQVVKIVVKLAFRPYWAARAALKRSNAQQRATWAVAGGSLKPPPICASSCACCRSDCAAAVPAPPTRCWVLWSICVTAVPTGNAGALLLLALLISP